MRPRLLVLALAAVVLAAALVVGFGRSGLWVGDRRGDLPAAPPTTLAEPGYTPVPAGFPDGETPEPGK